MAPQREARACPEPRSSSGEPSRLYPPRSHIQAAPGPSAMSLSASPCSCERRGVVGFYCNITGRSWWKSGLKPVGVHLKEARTSPRLLLPPPSSPLRSLLFNLLISAGGQNKTKTAELKYIYIVIIAKIYLKLELKLTRLALAEAKM